MNITINRFNNLVINRRALKIFINDKFVDYIEPNEKNKKIKINFNDTVYLKMGWCKSNKIKIEETENNHLELNVTSQIQNGLFIFIYSCFFSSFILKFANLINGYIGLALISPLSIIAYWQTFGKNSFLRLSKKND